jgi:hypothetical protein
MGVFALAGNFLVAVDFIPCCEKGLQIFLDGFFERK